MSSKNNPKNTGSQTINTTTVHTISDLRPDKKIPPRYLIHSYDATAQKHEDTFIQKEK